MAEATSGAGPLRVFVVDDEPLAIERLQLLLARRADVMLVGTALDGESALRLIEAVRPDVLLLDIAMPGMDGIEVARAVGRLAARRAIIFVTAFDNFALAAFDVAAVDYLLKPVEEERLARALDRARATVGTHMSAAPPAAAPSRFVQEFWVSQKGGLVRVDARDVEKITAERDYMRLHAGGRSWLIYHTIGGLEEELDPELFIRIHRSVILRRDLIAALEHDESGGWRARLSDGSAHRVGRSHVAKVKAIAGR
ncbi:MAG: response regulator transcription factor [Sphingomonadaceae bacterium]|nr:response regulator transcription factor [Sphingomonadaceae bacterium]